MYFELLALEIHARMAGMNPAKPPVVRGSSGVTHKFSFLASDESITYGFDIYDDVTQEEVIRTYAKKLDTSAYIFIVNLRGKPRPEAADMAEGYGITILNPADVDKFFDWVKAEARPASAPLEFAQ